jgi:hypothetical protein
MLGFGIPNLPAPQTRSKPTCNEGYIVDSGELIGARVVKAAFLHKTIQAPRDGVG